MALSNTLGNGSLGKSHARIPSLVYPHAGTTLQKLIAQKRKLIFIFDVPVVRHRLMIMAALAKGLPVFFVPEELCITTMRYDMVNDCRRNETSLCLAANAPRMTFQEELPGLLPLSTVATCLCTVPVALALPFVFVTIFSSIGYQPGAARILAGRLRSSWHLHHLRHQKRTDSISPRPFILFISRSIKHHVHRRFVQDSFRYLF